MTTRPPRTAPDEALAARYRSAASALDDPWNEVLDTLLAHRSVRAYGPDRLPEGLLETVVAAAQSAPTSSNLQVWSVVAVEDADRKARLADLAGGQRHMVECPLLMVWLADLSRLRALGRERGRPTDGLDFVETLLLAVIDTALAAQNAVVALESLGYGTVYIGGLRNRPEAVADVLGLPPEVLAVFGLCVGVPDPVRPASVKPRLPAAAVLHREVYGGSPEPGLIEAYDRDLAAFQAEQAMATRGWSATVLERVAGPQSLSGRDRMRQALAARGFAMR